MVERHFFVEFMGVGFNDNVQVIAAAAWQSDAEIRKLLHRVTEDFTTA